MCEGHAQARGGDAEGVDEAEPGGGGEEVEGGGVGVERGELESVGGYDVRYRMEMVGGRGRGGEDAGGFCGGDGLEDCGCAGVGAREGEPGVKGGRGPVCVGDEDGGEGRGEREHAGEGGGWDGFQDGHVGHGEGEVFVRVVHRDVLRCAGGRGHCVDARRGHARGGELVQGGVPREVGADGASELDRGAEEVGCFGDVVGYAAEGLGDDGGVGGVGDGLEGGRGVGKGGVVTGEIDG